MAHYYTDGDLQALAEETGGYVADSLEMARFGSRATPRPWWWRGALHGRDRKILNPEKRVLMPDLAATCSLDEGCPAGPFRAPSATQHPDHTVVVYANTSAAVKARSDWVVTSSIALPIVEHLAAQGREDPVGARQAPGPLRGAR